MKKKLIRKMALVALAIAVCLLVGSMIISPTKAPVSGNVIAANRIKTYVGEVYPELEAKQGFYAPRNKTGGGYFVRFTDAGGETVDIVCDINGRIQDDGRAAAYFEEHEKEPVFESINEASTSFGYLACSWMYNEPNSTHLALYIAIAEDTTVPSPESEDEVQDKLTGGLLKYYETLQRQNPVLCDALTSCRGYYMHYATTAKEIKTYDNITYQIDVTLENGEALTKDMLQGAKLTQE